MKKYIKKTLGIVLTSAAIITSVATTAFAINASNEKSLSQNKNTSSYKSIYAQQVGQKTTFTKTITQPTTTTSTDGAVTYTLTNFDPNTMDISLVQGSNGTLGTYNTATKTIEVLELSNGQHAQIQVIPKSGKTWTDGTNTAQKSSTFTPAQTYVGISTKPTFTKVVKHPTTTNSPDGEVTYTLTNFDPNTMDISLVPGSNGTLGTYDPATNTVKVTGLKVGQHAQIMVSTKSDTTIEGVGAYDVTPSGKMFTKDEENYKGRFPVNPSIKLESSKFTANKNSLINFDFTMKSLTTNKNNPGYKEIMTQGQHSKHVHDYFVFDKKLQKWTYNGKNVEGKANAQAFYLTTYDEKNATYHPRARIWVESYDSATSKMSIKYDFSMFYSEKIKPGGSYSSGNNNFAISDIKILSSQTSMPYEPNGGLLKNQKSSTFTPAQTHLGITKPTFTKTVTQPTTTTSTNGEVTYTFTNFDPNTMNISLAQGSNGTLGAYDQATSTVKVTGLKVGQHAQIQVTPNSGEAWADGTKTAQKSSTFTPAQTYVGITKPTLTKEVKLPTTKTSTDGEVTYTLTNFDPKTMNISLVPGASGILGKYDPQTKQIKITGLANGQVTQIQFTLKNKNDIWTDGKTIATIGLEKIKIVSNDLPLVLIIPLSVLGALIIIFLIYAQRFYFSFKTIQKVTALNLRIFKTRIRLLGLKFTNALFKSK